MRLQLSEKTSQLLPIICFKFTRIAFHLSKSNVVVTLFGVFFSLRRFERAFAYEISMATFIPENMITNWGIGWIFSPNQIQFCTWPGFLFSKRTLCLFSLSRERARSPNQNSTTFKNANNIANNFQMNSSCKFSCIADFFFAIAESTVWLWILINVFIKSGMLCINLVHQLEECVMCISVVQNLSWIMCVCVCEFGNWNESTVAKHDLAGGIHEPDW